MRTLILLIAPLLLFSCQQGTNDLSANAEKIEFEVLTKGTVIELEPHVKKQGFTIFDFYADWCPPCTKLNRSLKDMKRVYGDQMHVFKLDVVDWESEIAKHHNIRELPHLIVYNADGTLFAQGPSKEVLPALVAALNQNNSSS